MSTKSYLLWDKTKTWVQANPGKTAAIVTPDGVFRLTFEASPEGTPLTKWGAVDETAPTPPHWIWRWFR